MLLASDSLVVNDATWFALGVASTLLSAFVAHRIGRIQISFMQKRHELDMKLAAPKLGTVVRIEKRTPPNRPDVVRYFLCTSIYNEGDLAAKKIDGNWNLTCSESGQDRTVPIKREYLGNGSYDLEAQELGGNAMTNAINSSQATINVDIEFTYLGLDDQTPEKYHAHYQYDPKQKQMVKA